MPTFIFRNQVLPEIQQGPKDVLALGGNPNVLELFLKRLSNKNSIDIFLDKSKLEVLIKCTVNLDFSLENRIATNRLHLVSPADGNTLLPE